MLDLMTSTDEDLAVKVRVQRSGGGMAEVSPMNVNAGDAMSTITVTYTADGQIDAGGQLKTDHPRRLGRSDIWQRDGHRRRFRCYYEG